MQLAITAPYAALLTVLFIVLTQMVIITRNRVKVPLGDGGDTRLIEANRRQMNFVENVPLALILMILAEAGGAGSMLLNIAGSVLVVARIVHPFGITVANQAHPLRIAGAVASNGVMVVLIVVIARQYFA